MNISENSSRSYWVTRPVGMMRHVFPSALIVRVGISGQLHFAVDAGRIERRIGRRRVRARECVGVGRLDELEKGTRQARLLEDPEMALRARIMLLLSLHALEELLSVPG